MSPRVWRLAAVAGLWTLLHVTGAAQLATRPAEEWMKVLDAPERLAGLRIPDVTAALKLAPGEVVADLGAGTGPFVVPFAQAVGAAGKVYAVELDRGFFPFIERKARDAGMANVHIVAGEPNDPKLPSRDVDVAFIHDVLHHVENREAYLKSVTSYLKPTGRVVVIDYHAAQSPHRDQPSLVVSKEQAAAWLASAGLKPVSDVPLFTEKWFVIYGRR